MKIDKIVRNIDLPSDGIQKNMNWEVQKIRKLVKITDNDGFFRRNSSTSMMIGTILMWVSLAHISSGLTFSIS
jgi:uncharacterized membrane protein